MASKSLLPFLILSVLLLPIFSTVSVDGSLPDDVKKKKSIPPLSLYVFLVMGEIIKEDVWFVHYRGRAAAASGSARTWSTYKRGQWKRRGLTQQSAWSWRRGRERGFRSPIWRNGAELWAQITTSLRPADWTPSQEEAHVWPTQTPSALSISPPTHPAPTMTGTAITWRSRSPPRPSLAPNSAFPSTGGLPVTGSPSPSPPSSTIAPLQMPMQIAHSASINFLFRNGMLSIFNYVDFWAPLWM